ncbi:hypothetical protein [Paraburkholderia terricola]|uniref:hypothetical protein n=1 Tax=Paraburkholderia terricola TaxID=169427 RepID=UPI00286B5242|nr:hypothetical protein [Paraburkholderia terricola]
MRSPAIGMRQNARRSSDRNNYYEYTFIEADDPGFGRVPVALVDGVPMRAVEH